MIKIVTKEKFEYFIDLLEEDVKSGKVDTNKIFDVLRCFNDSCFYSLKQWQEHERQSEIERNESLRDYEKWKNRGR